MLWRPFRIARRRAPRIPRCDRDPGRHGRRPPRPADRSAKPESTNTCRIMPVVARSTYASNRRMRWLARCRRGPPACACRCRGPAAHRSATKRRPRPVPAHADPACSRRARTPHLWIRRRARMPGPDRRGAVRRTSERRQPGNPEKREDRPSVREPAGHRPDRRLIVLAARGRRWTVDIVAQDDVGLVYGRRRRRHRAPIYGLRVRPSAEAVRVRPCTAAKCARTSAAASFGPPFPYSCFQVLEAVGIQQEAHEGSRLRIRHIGVKATEASGLEQLIDSHQPALLLKLSGPSVHRRAVPRRDEIARRAHSSERRRPSPRSRVPRGPRRGSRRDG